MLPVRHELIGQMVLFCRSMPLPRARLNKYKKTLYQPNRAQAPMLTEIARYQGKIKILAHPVIIDSYIQFKKRHQLFHPTHVVYGDTDNHAKAIHDNLVKIGIVYDDRYIVGHSTTKAFGSEDVVLVKFWSVLDCPMEGAP
jgi:Holliday junction resolvase RusA-like endonuclease